MSQGNNPQTPEEWQEAVNQAEFILLLDSAVLYGLIETDITYNRERAIALLEAGKAQGYFPVEPTLTPEPAHRKRGRPRKIRQTATTVC